MHWLRQAKIIALITQIWKLVAQTALVNRDLKWESTAIGDFGVDITAFNGFNVTFDWYRKKNV